ncbi:MAG: hypothetical protein ACI4PD_08400, partial [Butyricicoccus sp.]
MPCSVFLSNAPFFSAFLHFIRAVPRAPAFVKIVKKTQSRLDKARSAFHAIRPAGTPYFFTLHSYL